MVDSDDDFVESDADNADGHVHGDYAEPVESEGEVSAVSEDEGSADEAKRQALDRKAEEGEPLWNKNKGQVVDRPRITIGRPEEIDHQVHFEGPTYDVLPHQRGGSRPGWPAFLGQTRSGCGAVEEE